jgi:hypothetical protein
MMKAMLLPSAIARSGIIVRAQKVHSTSALARYPT